MLIQMTQLFNFLGKQLRTRKLLGLMNKGQKKGEENKEDNENSRLLKQRGFKSLEELKNAIDQLEVKLNIKEKTTLNKFDLLDISDSELNPDQIKRKKMQKIQQKLAIHREQKNQEALSNAKKLEQISDQDRINLVKNLYDQRCSLLESIEKRKILRQQQSKRGSLATKNRLKTMAGMIYAQDTDKIQHHQKRNESSEDEFGLNDDDWDVYRNVNKVDYMGYDEEDEEDQEKINTIENKIAELDPEFTFNMLQSNSKIPTEKDFQINLGLNQYRPIEQLFQPQIIGCEFQGISEIINNIQLNTSIEQQQKIFGNIVLTGGASKIKGLKQRLQNEIQQILKFVPNIKHPYTESYLKENLADANSGIFSNKDVDPQLDAWRGSKKFVDTFMEDIQSAQNVSFTKEEYFEHGPYSIKKNLCSNYQYD